MMNNAMDNKIAQLRWKCRRGMLELDVLLNRYLSQRYETSTSAEQEAFAALLDCEDPDLFAWLVHGNKPPTQAFEAIIARIRTYDNR